MRKMQGCLHPEEVCPACVCPALSGMQLGEEIFTLMSLLSKDTAISSQTYGIQRKERK